MLKGADKFGLFTTTVDAFTAADYVWIGIDHFARADDELSLALAERKLHRNFMGYATKPAPHMLAFGMSGIGDVCDRFVQNDPDLAGWTAGVAGGEFPVVKGHVLDAEDRLRRQVVLNLMCNLELPWSLTEAEFGAPADELLAADLDKLTPLIDDGLVERDPTGLRITHRGRFFVRNAAMCFDAYLGGKPDGPLFSKTV
jgi:oxygen-independent coproporphyrinogen-3 oxidase